MQPSPTAAADRPEQAARSSLLVSGNRLTALGAISAGCRFFAGYPITPSSEIYQTMVDELPARGGLALAAPDEITSLAACVGASMRGQKVMTATSGPGFCLMVETLQYALMTETPVVVALVQRLGPSTGGATQGGQGDVLLVEFCTSGGYTIPVFAPSTALECYQLTRRAFEWSERLRTPVVLLSDKEVGMTLETVDPAALDEAPVASRVEMTESLPYYARSCSDEVPLWAPVGGPHRVVATGSAHDYAGQLRKNSPEVLAVLEGLQGKIDAHAGELARASSDLQDGATTLVVSWGVSARAARQAVLSARQHGKRVSFFQPLTLFPVPAGLLAAAVEGCERVVIAEENLRGLYAGVLEPHLAGHEVVRVNRVGGMIRPAEIEAAL